MFVILEWSKGEPPKLGTDLLYDTKYEAIDAASWELAQCVGRPPRLTVHPVGGVGPDTAGAAWDSDVDYAQARR
jgi:hypothetical protein